MVPARLLTRFDLCFAWIDSPTWLEAASSVCTNGLVPSEMERVSGPDTRAKLSDVKARSVLYVSGASRGT